MKRLVFVVNAPEFFISHRLPLAVGARKEGYDIHVATAGGADVATIQSFGFTHHRIDIARSGQNPWVELKLVFQLCQLFREIKPDIVHLVTIKPVLYGGVAARLTGVKAVVAAVSGLGTVFVSQSVISKVRRKLVSFLYRQAFRHKHLAVIFQNPDDRASLLVLGALAEDRTRLIRGSGVDLERYPSLPEPEGVPVVVMAARLLREKGVYEFVEAARILEIKNIIVCFRLIGSLDPGNPTSVSQAELDVWAAEGVVEVLGFRRDIAAQYSASNIVCLPSFYGEGLPKSLVEAAACGRAIITTDMPGCRDAIEPNVTGVLVPAKNAQALADAVQELLESPALRHSMGRAGRELAEREFAIEKITEAHLRIYGELLTEAIGTGKP